jgi:hypothetical protein
LKSDWKSIFLELRNKKLIIFNLSAFYEFS